MKKLTRSAVLMMTMSLTLSSLFSVVRSAPEASSLKLAKKFEQLGDGGMMGTPYLLDLQSGKVRYLGVSDGALKDIATSPDGRWLLGEVGGPNDKIHNLYIYNVADGRTKLMAKLPDISSYHWESTSTSFIIYYDAYKKSRPYRYKRKRFSISQPLKSQNLPAGYADKRAYSPNREYYFSSIASEGVFVVKRTHDGKELRRFPKDVYESVDWSVDSKRLFLHQFLGNDLYQVSSWNVASNKVRLIGPDRNYSPDEKWFLASEEYYNGEGTNAVLYISHVDGKGRVKVTDTPVSSSIFGLQWLRDGHHVLVGVGHLE